MANGFTNQAILVSGAAYDPDVISDRLALFNEQGAAVVVPPVNPAFPAVTTATAVGTAAKTTTSAEPAANTIVPIKFTSGNTAATPTVAFNGGTARAIQLAGVAPTAAEITVGANGVALFWFDGTILHQLGVYA